jgi:ATP-dependent exoDNAse (exonuclease V) beta subunit
VRERPPAANGDRDTSVHPGAHRPIAGEHSVVWWDPRALRLGVDEDTGVRQQWILEPTPVAAEEGKRVHEEWVHRRAQCIAKGSTPSRVVRTATSIADEARGGHDGHESAPVVTERVVVDRTSRPRGPRFGALVHATLATIDLRSADAAAIGTIAKVQARALGAPADEVDAATRTIVAALDHPLLVRARNASIVRRECPVVLREDDGTITEGVLDLAFRDEGGWTVVDFKTDAAEGERAASYAAQVRAYARAVAVATGVAARGVLLSL